MLLWNLFVFIIYRLSKYHNMEIIEVMNSNIRGEKDNIITIQIEEKQLSYIEFAKLIDSTLILSLLLGEVMD